MEELRRKRRCLESKRMEFGVKLEESEKMYKELVNELRSGRNLIESELADISTMEEKHGLELQKIDRESSRLEKQRVVAENRILMIKLEKEQMVLRMRILEYRACFLRTGHTMRTEQTRDQGVVTRCSGCGCFEIDQQTEELKYESDENNQENDTSELPLMEVKC